MSAEIILAAAGEGRRMGRWKPGVLFKGEPLLFHALRAALQTPWPVVLVGGYDFPALVSLVTDFFKIYPFETSRLKLTENPGYSLGPATTFLHGIEKSTADWLFFSLADLPFITSETYQMLFNEKIHPGCRPIFKTIPGHPVLISRDLIPRILDRHRSFFERPDSGELAMRKLVGPLHPLDWPDKAVISDIDTAQELI
jgi:CTP:molybdopterin cytidylyltransferase MocA